MVALAYAGKRCQQSKGTQRIGNYCESVYSRRTGRCLHKTSLDLYAQKPEDHFILSSRSRMKSRTRRYPTFAGLRPTSPASSRAKQANASKNTIVEMELCAALRQLGLRFETHCESMPGRPDIVFPTARVAVFCDGDFWHGRNWRKQKPLLQRRANSTYWVAKITANRRRDREVTRFLTQEGWCVLRLWEGDVRTNALRAAGKIALLVEKKAETRTE